MDVHGSIGRTVGGVIAETILSAISPEGFGAHQLAVLLLAFGLLKAVMFWPYAALRNEGG